MSRIHRVVLLVIDGLRPEAVSPTVMPSLACLAASGWSAEARTVRPSVTIAALTSLATGVPPERHGVVDARLPAVGALRGLQPLPLVLKRHGHLTRIVTGPLPTPHRVLSRTLLGLAGVGSLITAALNPRDLARTGEREQERLAAALTIIYLNDCDRAGHREGWMSRGYLAAARAADSAVAELVDTVIAREGGLLLVTADHGGGGLRPRITTCRIPPTTPSRSWPAGRTYSRAEARWARRCWTSRRRYFERSAFPCRGPIPDGC